LKNYLLSGIALGAVLVGAGPAYSAGTPTSLNVTVPPTGTPFSYNCVGGASPCWPLVSIYDGTTTATVNAGNNGLNVNVVGGSIANITGTVTLPTGASTSALQTAVQSAAGTPDAIALTVQGNASGVPIPVTGSLSASITGFQPTPSYAQLAVSTGSSARVPLPIGNQIIVYNTGANPAYVTLGNSSITATTANDAIQPDSAQAFTPGSATNLAAISTGGATALNISGGAGLPTGWGGGGTGGGGGGGNASVSSTGSAVPGSATFSGMNVSGNLTGLTGTANGLKVDGSGVTQPISASSLPLPTSASTAANQVSVQAATGGSVPASAVLSGMSVSGTMTALPGTSNGLKVDGSAVNQPVTGTFWQATQPVSAASLPLPSGAATAALQPTNAAQASTTSGQTGHLGEAAVSTSAPSYTTGQTDPLSLTTAGALRTDSSAVTQPVSAASLPLPSGAATDAHLTNVQTSPGTPASTAITIQGNASGVPLPVTGTLSASVGGFTPTPSYAQLAVSGSSSRVALPTGTSVIVYNTGSNPAYVVLGNGAVTATANNDVIPAGSWTEFSVGAAVDLAAIETAGSTTLTISGGAGLATGAIAGSSASSGPTGSAVPSIAGYVGMNVSGNLTGLTGTGNGLKVDGSAVTQPVSGTFWQSSQPVTGTFWQATQPVSASALPLPTGASTAALQPTNATLGSTTSGQTGNLDIAAVTTSAPSYTTGQSNALSLNTSGGLRVDGSAVTQPVSAASLPLPTGAATAALQPTNAAQASATSGQTGHLAQAAVTTGSPSYTTGQTDPMSLTTAGALRTDASATTQPVSAVSLPLPTGAATAALQPTNATQGSTTSGQTGPLVQAAVTTGAPSFTNGQTSPLTQTLAGALRVDGSAVTQPVSAASLPLPTGSATSALQTTGNTALATINTTLGSPMQASGGTVAVTQATASSLNTTARMQDGSGNALTSSGGALNVSGSFSATLSGFAPNGNYATPLTVSSTSSRVALPSGTTVVVYNTGSNGAYTALGNSSVVATTSNDFIAAGGWMAFTVGANVDLAAIETQGGTTLNISGGSGLPTGATGNASVGATGLAAPGTATLGGMSVGGTMTALPGTSNGLKVDASSATLNVNNPTAGATGAAVPSSAALVGGPDNSGNLRAAQVTAPGTSASNFAIAVQGVTGGIAQPVSAAALPLPSGAATSANQTTWQGPTGSAVTANAALNGARAASAAPTPVTDGQMVALTAGLEGKLVILPFSVKESMVRGTASQTGTTPTTLIGAQGSGVKLYITGVQCKNTSATGTFVTLNDSETTGSGTILIVPAGGGDNEVYQTPLVVAANTALTFTPSVGQSTIYCNAQGYTGS
jgi:hypothetical protein